MIEPLDIEVAHVFEAEFPLVKPDGTETGETMVNVVVNLVTAEGIGGWGSAAPRTDSTGETPEATLQAAGTALAGVLVELPPRPYWDVVKLLEEAAPGAPAARAAFDIALHDIWSKMMGASLQAFLGTARYDIQSSGTVSEKDLNRAVDEAGEVMARGFEILRVIGTGDHGEDVERVKEIRRDFGRKARIRLDARGAYTPDQARQVIKELSDDIELLEQPVAKEEKDALVEIAGNSPVPVAADESAMTEKEAYEVIFRGVPVVKVDLMKCGGLGPALRICDMARLLGARVIVGCGMETSISATAAAHVAVCRPAVELADMDLYTRVDHRAVGGGLRMESGRISLPGRPGLGVNVRKDYLRG